MLQAKDAFEKSMNARELRKEKYFPIFEEIIERKINEACNAGEICTVIDFAKESFDKNDSGVLLFYNNFGVVIAYKLEEDGYSVDFRSDSMLISWGNANVSSET